MALFLKASSPDIWSRLIVRVFLAALIPCAIVAWLLYSAAANEEITHTRNLRWLAQMGALEDFGSN
jgi:hypothetical protein